MTRKPKVGRPPLDRVTVRVNIRVGKPDHERWLAAAERDGSTLSEWLRYAADLAIEHERRR